MTAERAPTVAQLLESVDLPRDFLDRLLNESDWSLIIKLHAVFEAVLASLIVRRLHAPEAASIVSHLDFNNVKSGKVAFARALGLLDGRNVAFLRGLSELRNMLVHDVHNVQFRLADYVASLSLSGLRQFKSSFGYPLCQLENGEAQYAELLRTSPSALVHAAAYGCLLNLQFQITGHTRNMLVEALLRHSRG